ncbi:MAG: type I glyceraldehyde-3-phosphate dehydrogenase [Alphaproteobacteria bacterium]
MSLRIGINGFGRIGRLVARAIYETDLHKHITLAAINDTGDNTLLLLKYDSVHGPAPFEITRESESIKVFAGHKVHRFRTRNPADIDWSSQKVDIVLECTGQFTDREGASAHLHNGAKKVLISAPAKGDDLTVVYGVNDGMLKAEHTVVSNASCTTNCLAPVAFMLHEEIGIEHGFMTTIHAYTGDQRTVDSNHRDPYRGRAAALNLIPTSTGAAKALGKVIHELEGKLDGVAIRVPTPNVSLVDFKFTAKRDTSVEDINEIAKKYAAGRLKNILDVYDEPLVSTDFNHNPHSAMFSLEGTSVIDKRFVRVMAWYDNEWAFSLRMLETALKMHQAGYKK